MDRPVKTSNIVPQPIIVADLVAKLVAVDDSSVSIPFPPMYGEREKLYARQVVARG